MSSKQEKGPSESLTELYEKIKLYVEGQWITPQREPNDWTSRVGDILLSENLIVLAGLGTSLCLNTKGKSIAPGMADLWQSISRLPNFEKLVELVGHDPAEQDVELLLSRCQLYQFLKQGPAELSEFVNESEGVIHEMCNFPAPGTALPTHQLFLRKVARRSIRQPRMRLFTTNYDLCFERASAGAGFIAIDGFSHTTPSVFDGSYFAYDFVKRDVEGAVPDFIPNVFQLLKLHGSTDWVFQADGVVVKGLLGKHAMIFPRYGKFESSYQQPYFEMMARLQAALRQPNTGLIVIGYGCRDQHINEPLESAIRANVGLKLAFVDPKFPENLENPFHTKLKDLADSGDTRVLLVAATFEEFTKYIPDLIAETEQEAHFERIRRR